VDLREAEQPGHRDGPLATFVRTEHGGLELEGRASFDVVEGQPFLTPNCPEALTDACSGRRHLISPLARLLPPEMPSASLLQYAMAAHRSAVSLLGRGRTVGDDRTSTLRESHASPRSQHQPRGCELLHTYHSRHTRPACSINNATAAIGAVSAF